MLTHLILLNWSNNNNENNTIQLWIDSALKVVLSPRMPSSSFRISNSWIEKDAMPSFLNCLLEMCNGIFISVKEVTHRRVCQRNSSVLQHSDSEQALTTSVWGGAGNTVQPGV